MGCVVTPKAMCHHPPVNGSSELRFEGKRRFLTGLVVLSCFGNWRGDSGNPSVTLEQVTPPVYPSGALFPSEERIVKIFEKSTYSVVNIFDVTLRPNLISLEQKLRVWAVEMMPGGSTSSGVGFAIPSSTILKIIPQLIQFGRVTRAGLNVDIAPELVSNQLNVRNGALILLVRSKAELYKVLDDYNVGDKSLLSAVEVSMALASFEAKRKI
ncbi:Protease Do-like 8, chloroplastic-like protein [Drosera capensis]